MKPRYKTNVLGIAFFMISLIKSAIAIELPDDLKQEVDAYFHTAKPLCERILNRESYKTEESTLKLFEDLGTFLEDKEVPHLLKYSNDEDPGKMPKNSKETYKNLLLNKEFKEFIKTIKDDNLRSLTFDITLTFRDHHILEEYKYSQFLIHPFLLDIFRLTLLDGFMRHFYNLSKKFLTTKIKDKVDVTTLIFPEPVGLYELDGERVNIRNTVGYANTNNFCGEYGLKGQLCKTVLENWDNQEITLKEVKKLTTYFDENNYEHKVIIFF